MPGNLQPLDSKFQIVNPDGTPTLFFIRWAQQRQIDIGDGISAAQCLQIINQFMADHQISAGTGIQITPSGNIADGITIAADIQAALDSINTTQGVIIFKGATDWEALAPGTSGQFLQTQGAAANPQWASGGGGGGGAMTLISQFVATGSETNWLLSSIPATYKDLIISGYGRASTGSSQVIAGIVNSDNTSSNYRYQQVAGASTSTSASQNTSGGLSMGQFNGSSATANSCGVWECIIPQYAGTTFFKDCLSNAFFKNGTGDTNYVRQFFGSEWRNTSAISSIDFQLAAGTFVAGSTIAVYGRA